MAAAFSACGHRASTADGTKADSTFTLSYGRKKYKTMALFYHPLTQFYHPSTQFYQTLTQF